MKKININNKSKIIIAVIATVIFIVMFTGILCFAKANKKIISTDMQFKYLGYDKFYETSDNTLLVKEANAILMSIYFEQYGITSVTENVDKIQINEDWMEFGYDNNIVSRGEGANKLSYIRFFEMLYDARIKISNDEIYKKNNLNLKTEEYPQNEIEALNYLYDKGLINHEVISKDFLYNDVEKKYFEDILIKYIFKFSLMCINDNQINYEASLNISQYENYFFVIKEASTKELEKRLHKKLSSHIYEGPKEIYSSIITEIPEINKLINNYFNLILNVNPEIVDSKSFANDIKSICIVSNDEINKYCEYVKENNINLNGKGTVISPIIYKIDGVYYVRTKIELNIENSDTMYNVLLGDLDEKEKYKNNTTKYIDIPIIKETFDWKISTNKLSQYVVK